MKIRRNQHPMKWSRLLSDSNACCSNVHLQNNSYEGRSSAEVLILEASWSWTNSIFVMKNHNIIFHMSELLRFMRKNSMKIHCKARVRWSKQHKNCVGMLLHLLKLNNFIGKIEITQEENEMQWLHASCECFHFITSKSAFSWQLNEATKIRRIVSYVR